MPEPRLRRSYETNPHLHPGAESSGQVPKLYAEDGSETEQEKAVTKSSSELRREWEASRKRVNDQIEMEWYREMSLQLLEVVLVNGSSMDDVKKLYNQRVSQMRDIDREVRHTSDCTIDRGHCSCGSARTVARLLDKVYRPQLREMRKAELKNGKG